MSPLAWLPRFRRAYRDLPALAARESWERSVIEGFQLEQLQRIWQYATTHVAYYRELSAQLELPQTFDSLDHFRRCVPLLEKRQVREQPKRFLSDCASPGAWYPTGGSTGTPMPVFRARSAHLYRLQAQYRFFQSWGVDIFDPTAHLWGHGSSLRVGVRGLADRIMLPMYDLLRRRRRLSAYSVSPQDLRGYLRQIQRFQARAIYAYSTAAYLLAREALETGFRCDSLKAVFLTAEPAYPHIVSAVQEAFGAPAVIEYGSIEAGPLAAEATDRTLRIREDFVLIESLPRPDGQYDLAITCLTNPEFPLLRYLIGDITSRPIVFPSQGFAILHDVAGRDNALLRSQTGRYLHGTWFEEIVEQHPQVRRYRIHQAADGSVSVQLELEPTTHSFDGEPIRRRYEAHLEGYPVRVAVVEALENTTSGKHTWISSELAPRTRAETHTAPVASQQPTS